MKVFDDYEAKLCLEKLVIGLEEPILIKGVGAFLAKVDSGNGGYNVLHGENVVQQGDVITFKTYDENEQPKMVSKKLKEFINVNIGSGNIEERPVIELDVKFAGDMYRKIPFSVANRTSNTHRVLICKDFVEKELEALIDVSGKSITKDDKVEVEYVTEGVKNVAKNVAKSAGKFAAGAAKTGAKNFGLVSQDTIDAMKNTKASKGQKAAYAAKKTGMNILKGMQQMGKAFEDSTLIDTKVTLGIMDGYADQAAEDSALIKKKVAKMDPKLFGFKDGEKISDQDILCFKLVDYLGKTFTSDEVVPSEKQMFDEYQQMMKNGMGEGMKDLQADKFSGEDQQDKTASKALSQFVKQEMDKQNKQGNQNQQPKQQPKQQGNQKNESFIDNLSRLLTEANEQQQPQQQDQNQEQQENADGEGEQQQGEQQQGEQLNKEGQEVSAKMSEYQKTYQNRNCFFAWFALVQEKAVEAKTKALLNEKITSILNQAGLSKEADKVMMNLGNGKVDAKNNAILSLFNTIRTAIANDGSIKGVFALCTTPTGLLKSGSRKVDIPEQYNIVAKEGEEQKYNPDDIKKDYNDLKNRWRENAFLKNVKLDINGKYDNEEKRGELKQIAENKVEEQPENNEGEQPEATEETAPTEETPQENEETITESFTPYISRYLKRLYGHSFYITEDANEGEGEQKSEEQPSEEQPTEEAAPENKEGEQQQQATGPQGEDALANVDFAAIASKIEDKNAAAKAAQDAETDLTNLVNTIQKGYFTFDEETRKGLTLESYVPEEVKEDEGKPEAEATDEEVKEEEHELVQKYNKILEAFKNNPILKHCKFEPVRHIFSDRTASTFGTLKKQLDSALRNQDK